jgi:hypothetical protein
MEEVLLAMVKKTMDRHVFLNHASAIVIFVSFDLWMFWGGVDTFVLDINFLSITWVPIAYCCGVV